jgi:hypothetical protein
VNGGNYEQVVRTRSSLILRAGLGAGIRGRTDRHSRRTKHVLRELSVCREKEPRSLPGVAKVTVSYEDKTAIVTYDDSRVGLDALTGATTNAGYPSTPKG